MSALSTIVIVVVTLLTRPTEDSVLSEFYQRVDPVGFWRKTAKKVALDSSRPLKEFYRGAYLTITISLSIYLLLIGLGKILFPIDSSTVVISIIYIAAGLFSVALWWRKMFNRKGNRVE